MITCDRIKEIISSKEFFNQRAPREVWSQNPFETQELDINSSILDLEKIRPYRDQFEKGDRKA